MKMLTRTMIVFVAVNMVVAGSAFTGNMADEAMQDATQLQAKQADLAQKEAELEQKRADLVRNLVKNKVEELDTRLSLPSVSVNRGVFLGSRFGETGSVLVVPSAEITTEEIAIITEDMNIMSRIFERNLEQAHFDVGSMFISHTDPFTVAFGRGRQTPQGMYLQGYGALFLMKVDFPLSPSPVKEQEKETEKKNEDVDPVWFEMKQQMYDPEGSRRQKKERRAEEYDAEKVANLKTALIKSLKHAANIRSLKSDESVILTVTGSSTTSGVRSVMVGEGNQIVMIDDKNRTRVFEGGIPDDMLSLPTVLVIRAKKSDIDGFAKGDLDLDQFQQNTQILTCAYLAGGAGSANPFTGHYYKTTR